MPNWTGSFNNSGTRVLKISVGGVFPALRQDFEALIDTGYTGFLSMPLVSAFPLGLLLYGTTGVLLADGSTSFRLTAWGHVRVGEEDQTGVIILEPSSSELLIGTELLRKFRKRLIVSHEANRVTLEDEPPQETPVESEAAPENPN